MSSSTTATASRSPSPSTPEASDLVGPITIQSELDSWNLSMNPGKVAVIPWVSDSTVCMTTYKSEEEHMLRLDDLIEQHAYDDSPNSEFNSNQGYSPPPSLDNPPSLCVTVDPVTHTNNLLISSSRTLSSTMPIPPPASLPRKASSHNQRVIHPPRDSCFNLPIMFPSIPEGGTKSRVETQVRVTVDLGDMNPSSDPRIYDRVGSWKWLRLPSGTATKRRTRKQGKIDPNPEDILHLNAVVTCASPPHNRVLSCSSCQAREAKRVAKKVAARVRPVRSDSDSDGEAVIKPHKSRHLEDTTSIIQFNCADTLDYSTGSVVLPLRITCYCRHHREKVGFNIHLSMIDHTGRIIGSGISGPIMITDDHKTSTGNRNPDIHGFNALEHPDWSQVGRGMNEMLAIGDNAPSRRKKDIVNASNLKKRRKPYDSTGKPDRVGREESVSSAPSPSSSHSGLPVTRAPTPSSTSPTLLHSKGAKHHPLPNDVIRELDISALDSIRPISLDLNSDMITQERNPPFPSSEDRHDVQPPAIYSSSDLMLSGLSSIPYLFFNQSQTGQSMQLTPPVIHRLIPSTGPTHGGIEVTVLGANFPPTTQLNCVFGDVTASSTQRWSDNTLVCILPPRSMPGVVPVWFEGFPETNEQSSSPLSMFTYSDDSDRALMELALQVVGLKMTGKIEDAKNIAMRIVGNAGNETSETNNNGNEMMQLAETPALRDMRSLLFVRGENNDFENRVLNFLSLIDTPVDNSTLNQIPTSDAVSCRSASGQTLLHLCSFLGFSSLATFLVSQGADLDARDLNGFTPLHFAALSQSGACASILVEAGADREIVNANGKTAEEISLSPLFADSVSDTDYSKDEDAEFGDVEDDDVPLPRIPSRRILRHLSRHNNGTSQRSIDISRAATPPVVVDKVSSNNDAKTKEYDDSADAKRAASFMEKMIQRTLAQIPTKQDIIPNISQLPLPHLPDLPAVPWGALPQIPMVFPVFVPMMPGWPSFLGGEHGTGVPGDNDDASRNVGGVALRTAQEWRATWEKWFAVAAAATARQQADDSPPPQYTPRAEGSESTQVSVEMQTTHEHSSFRPHGSEVRPVGYDNAPLPTHVAEPFGYQTSNRNLQKKHDRMLLWFWLPILLLSIVWAIHHGLHFAFRAIKLVLQTKSPLRRS